MTKYCIDLDDVKKAASRIEGTAYRTPVLTSSSFDCLVGKKFFFKVEAMQRTGSFKFRGALNAVKAEIEARGDSMSAVVSHSSGNFAQALAMASKLAPTPPHEVHATIVMPRNAPEVKQTAVRNFGATIVLVESTNEARESEADRIMKETGAVFIHPSDDPRVIAGQGTASLELVEQVQELASCDLDAVIMPVGGGGLASGNTIALRGLFDKGIKIVLAEPSKLDDAKRSFESRELLKHAPENKLDSVADGLKTTLGPNTWPIVRDLVDDVITVQKKTFFGTRNLFGNG